MTVAPPVTSFAMRLPAPARLLTTNAERSMHWARHGEITRLWREASAVQARADKAPKFAWVEIDVAIAQAKGVLADVGAHQPVVKAIIDGLVDAGVIENDDPEHVVLIAYRPPIKERSDAVVIKLKGELRG